MRASLRSRVWRTGKVSKRFKNPVDSLPWTCERRWHVWRYLGKRVLAWIGDVPSHVVVRRCRCWVWPFRVARHLQCDFFYMMRVHLMSAIVNIKTLEVGIDAYSQIMARTSWDPSCLTSFAAVAIEEITSTFDLPLAATRTLRTLSQHCYTEGGHTNCHGEHTATLFRFLAFTSPLGVLGSSLSLPSW